MKKAVIDRIVAGTTAVILVGDEEIEYNIDITALPDGAKEGSHLRVEIHAGELGKVELDQAASAATRERIQQKMELLRKRAKK